MLISLYISGLLLNLLVTPVVVTEVLLLSRRKQHVMYGAGILSLSFFFFLLPSYLSAVFLPP